ncbi:MAG: triose-phosphate isomerase [Candidatus Pacebacteria bacterium]|nr:triose-phosphate isomerase [Candidatus Paceibacterota bacterium]NUQ56990.1 triose-phosphate isomerase [Candidatus Paceibacter sp.]
MAKKIIVANWKMNPASAEEAKKIFGGIKKAAAKAKGVEVVVCPPFVYLSELGSFASKLELGAQDVFYEEKGAYTGEISPVMLKKDGVKYVIVGHSERRKMGETDEIMNKKTRAGLEAGLKIIFCVGEKARDADGLYFDEVRKQIENGLKGVKSKLLEGLVIAYEPVWSVSSGGKLTPDDPESVFKMSLFIRKKLLSFGDSFARGVPILYGGSVDSSTAGEFIGKGRVQGLLVGQKSLDPEEFGKILEVASNAEAAK